MPSPLVLKSAKHRLRALVKQRLAGISREQISSQSTFISYIGTLHTFVLTIHQVQLYLSHFKASNLIRMLSA